MRVYKKECFSGANEVYIFDDEEIELVKACSGFTQIGKSETTNCYDEGCYSLDNSDSKFYADLIDDFNDKFKTTVEMSDVIYDYSCSEAALIKYLEDETSGKGFDIEKFVSNYISDNENHEEREVVFTGRGNDIVFLSDNPEWEEITDDNNGKEIIKNFNIKEHDGDHGTGCIYSSPKFLFFASRVQGDTAGYSVEEK
ncbi:hypothetical protein KAR91_74900 [Candidatus Pacearchaeota archaeon]|nr:hypothetical protein [Candidatus Pacearchaeota archaeon]